MPSVCGYRWLWLIAILFTACRGDRGYTTREPEQRTPLQFEVLQFRDDVRRGAEVGLLITARVWDRRGLPERFHVRFALADSSGRPFLVDPYGGTPRLARIAEGKDSATVLVLEEAGKQSPIVGLDVPDGSFPAVVEFFWPHHRWSLPAGKHAIQVDLEAREGDLPAARPNNFWERWELSAGRRRVGKLSIRGEVERPPLRRVRLHVGYVELDNEVFDPHTMDQTGKRRTSPTDGFPDLYWAFGVGYERVYNSDYLIDAIGGRWSGGTGDVWVRGLDEVISLCAMDQDEGLSLDDIISCWEGRLGDLSGDPAQPTRLKFGRVRRMEVWLDWRD
ncbi:MAG: hypothetical protein AAGN35_06040 [Bacteroidota bacterium]